MVDLANDFQIPRGEVGLLFESGFVFAPNMGEAGGTLGGFAFEALGETVLWIGVVGVTAEDTFKVRPQPVEEMMVFPIKLPVEEDVSVESFVEPETPGGAASRFAGSK